MYVALRIFVGRGSELGFCFIPALGITVGFPWGASKLIGVLMANPNRTCCTFFAEGIPFALLGKRSTARKAHLRSINQTTRSGRFALSRNEMAEVIEATAIRVWASICCFMVATVLYIVTMSTEVGCEMRKYDNHRANICDTLPREPTGRN